MHSQWTSVYWNDAIGVILYNTYQGAKFLGMKCVLSGSRDTLDVRLKQSGLLWRLTDKQKYRKEAMHLTLTDWVWKEYLELFEIGNLCRSIASDWRRLLSDYGAGRYRIQNGHKQHYY